MSIRVVLSARLLATILVVIAVSVPARGHAAPYCDPRVDSACYARWCAAMGGAVYNDARGYGCDAGAGGRGGGGSFGDQLWMGAAQTLANSFIHGLVAGIEQHQRAEAERLRRLEVERLAFIREFEEQERLRRKNEEERREEFRAIKERLLRQMGTTPGGQGDRSDLLVDEAPGTLGARELRPRDLRGPAAPLTPRPIRTPARALGAWERASCGAMLMHLAEAAAITGNLTEAAYLSEQAAGAMADPAFVPSVECPPGAAPAVPEVRGAQIRESAAMTAALRKHALALSTLFARTTQLMADRRMAAESAERSKHALARARQQREEAEAHVNVLESAPPGAQHEARERALADARAALRDAEALEAESARRLDARRDALKEIEARLEHDRQAAERLAKKPASAADDVPRDPGPAATGSLPAAGEGGGR